MNNSVIQLYTSVPIDITTGKVLELLCSTGRNNTKVAENAEKIYQQIDNLWSPAAVIRWLPVAASAHDSILLLDDTTGNATTLSMNHSARFMASAQSAMLAAYTVGPELELLARQATADGRYLDGYIIEQIGMIVLDEISSFVKNIVEEKSREKGWNVGPFLSPGSVHGWDLTEQSTLCSLIPINEIGLDCDENSVLHPFSSLSCLIGIGPDYTSSAVGSTCEVCSKRNDCRIKSEKSM